MKAGKLVAYVSAGGVRSDAVVLDVVGSGPSGYKLLDLQAGNRTIKGVAHKGDDSGRGYWDHPAREHAAVGDRVEAIPSPVVPVSGNAAGRATAGEVDLKE